LIRAEFEQDQRHSAQSPLASIPKGETQERANTRESLMAAYVIFDVEINDMARYQEEPVAKLFGTPLITPLKSRQCI